MDTISFDDLKQIIGELYLENALLKKKVGYLEDMINQLRPKEEGVAEQEKEGNLLRQETKKGD